MKIKQTGGKVIASGGFGCIFQPALTCDNDTTNNTNKITKLMTIKNATDEYKQIENFNSILQTIPNYDNYFLLKDITLCKPAKLTKSHLVNYKKCKALKKKGINSKNINKSLDKILALNMPDGGIDVDKFVQEYFVPSNIIKLNNSLIKLLVHGIIPMNKLNVYHCDVKDANVLVKITEMGLETRLIDWGLSFIHNDKKGIPRKIYRRPFQYNVPFSSVLFNKEFLNKYNEFLIIHPNPDYYQIREFVINYIFIWNEIRGPGHLNAINDIVKKLTISNLASIKKQKIKEHFVEYDFTYYYIIEYLSKILEKYTQNGKIELMTYFNTIFLKNIDIWGFTMTYICLYEYFYDSFESLSEFQMQFINKIKFIIIHFLFESPIEPINVSYLIDELTKLNPILEKITMKPNIGGKYKSKKCVKHSKPSKNKTRKLH
jgi:hypothetical protein